MRDQQVIRLQPLLTSQISSLSSNSSSSSRRVGEVAGVTAVECAAVCCCPCALFNFLILTIYKLPACLFHKAILRRKCQRQSRLQTKAKTSEPQKVVEDSMGPTMGIEIGDDVAELELEEEMWERFNGAGFWRSASQKMKFKNGSRRFQSLLDRSPSHQSFCFSDRFEFDATR